MLSRPFEYTTRRIRKNGPPVSSPLYYYDDTHYYRHRHHLGTRARYYRHARQIKREPTRV